MKKFFSLLLAAALVLSLCGSLTALADDGAVCIVGHEEAVKAAGEGMEAVNLA